MAETIQRAQIFSNTYGFVIADEVVDRTIYTPMQDVAKIPGYDISSTGVKTGRGYAIEDLGDCGLEFKVDLIFGEQYKSKIETLFKIFQSREPFFYKHPFSNLTNPRVSKINSELLTTLGFYVRLIEVAELQRSDSNIGYVTLTCTFAEVKYIAQQNDSLVATIDSALTSITDILSDINQYITFAKGYIQATTTFLNNAMNDLKSIGENISSLLTAVNSFANTIDRLINFPNEIATQYQALFGQLKSTTDRLMNVGNNYNEKKYSQNQVVKFASNLATYNSNPTVYQKINPRYNFINIDGTLDNITQGKFTFLYNSLGFILLLSFSDQLLFTSKEEIDAYITKLTNIKNSIFNNDTFNGLQSSNQSINNTLTNIAFDVSLLDIINSIFYQTLLLLRDNKIILGSQSSITLQKKTLVTKIIYQYYYLRLLAGIDYETIVQNFLIANTSIISVNDVLDVGTVVNLPII